MEQYLISNYTFDDKIYITNLITNYNNVEELCSTKTLHLHGSYYLLGYCPNVKFQKLEKIKAKVVVYGDCRAMFCNSYFNGDISNWDTSSVTNMYYMFESSDFNSNISNWDTSSVTNMRGMFYRSKFNGVISNWVISSVRDMSYMFCNSEFNRVISNWDTSSVINMRGMFDTCPAERPSWYICN